jgi:chaperonin GroES
LINFPPSVTLAQLGTTGGQKMKFKPLGERALIKPVEREEHTASGIVLPDTAKERPQTAEVVAVGEAEEIKVSIGDVVVFRRYGGTEFSLNGEEYLIVEADDVLGIVEK